MTASVLKRDPNTYKGSKERLFIMTQTHNLHIFGVIPFRQENNSSAKKDNRTVLENCTHLYDDT